MDSGDGLRIITYPDPVLRARADAVSCINGELIELADKMIVTMYGAPGIGLAANQVGRLKRIIVFDLEPGKPGSRPQVLINPEIIERDGSIVHEEACLSVLDFSGDVTRSERILVRGFDRNEKPVEIEAKGLLSVCLQHEIDHLDGILYIDHLSSLKRALYKRKLKKILASEQ